MELTELSKLRVALPHRYASIISQNLTGITPTQVRLVFSGKITNSNIVLPVVQEAMAILSKTKAISADLSEQIADSTAA